MLLLALAVRSGAVVRAAETPPTEVPNFVLLDQKGRAHELGRVSGKAVVIFVTGTGCPIARQAVPALKELRKAYFERGVTFWMLDANLQDDRASIAKEGEELDVDRIPILHDETQVVARQLAIARTAEAIAIELPGRHVFYRGPIDDRLSVGGQRAVAGRASLGEALERFLAGRAPAERPAPAAGCAVGLEPPHAVSYEADVAPLVARRCGACHTAGDARPRLRGYAEVRGATRALRQVLLERSMPPAAPDPRGGAKLVEGGALSALEAKLLWSWLAAGAPRAGGEDPLARPAAPPGAWPLGAPSAVVAAPPLATRGAPRFADFKVERDTWLSAAAARPDDPAHTGAVSVWAVTAKARALVAEWSIGSAATAFPEGTGLELAPGTRLELEVRDRKGAVSGAGARVGLTLAASPPRRRYELRASHADAITIPAGDVEAGRAFALTRLPRETVIHDFRPRLERRGAWFKVEALTPDGRRETLFSLPAYAGAWRLTYRLAEGKRLPAGTLLLSTAGYDNGPRRPGEPPPARVACAGAACDELFLGVVGASEDVGTTTAAAGPR